MEEMPLVSRLIGTIRIVELAKRHADRIFWMRGVRYRTACEIVKCIFRRFPDYALIYCLSAADLFEYIKLTNENSSPHRVPQSLLSIRYPVYLFSSEHSCC